MPFAPAAAPVVRPADVQRRTLGVLVLSQVLGGVGVASGIAVIVLLSRRIGGSDELAGLGTTAQVVGGALLAVPVTRLMSARGRRPGLVLGYSVAMLGALTVVAAAMIDSFTLLLLGSAMFGGAQTSNSQARYAAADLAEPHHRGRDLSTVVWATTIGSVAGPNLVGPAEPLARSLGLPPLTGSFVFSLAGFALAVLTLVVLLRPDPLLLARSRALADDASPSPHRSVGHGLRVVIGQPVALLGLLAMALGHLVMVSVMSMTPLHMDHGGASLRLVGLVISLHILGMYAFSPLTGLAVDRLGGRPVALVGSVVLAVAGALAGLTHEGMSGTLTAALMLLGVGWSCTLVAGSTMITGAVTMADRPSAQGASDLCMGLAGGGGGALAGVVVQHGGYQLLALGSVLPAALIVLAALLLRSRTEASSAR